LIFYDAIIYFIIYLYIVHKISFFVNRVFKKEYEI
jgi:hypothetical protein